MRTRFLGVIEVTLGLLAALVTLGCSSEEFRVSSNTAGHAGVAGEGRGGPTGRGGADAGGGGAAERGDNARGGAPSQAGARARGGASSHAGASSQAGAQARGEAGAQTRGGASSQAGSSSQAGTSSQAGAQARGGTGAQGGEAASGGAPMGGGAGEGARANAQGGLAGSAGTPCSEDCDPAGELRLTTEVLPDAWIGQIYWVELGVEGGTAPYSFGLSSMVPELEWLSLDETTGVLSGTPDEALDDPALLEVKVTDGLGDELRASYEMDVRSCVGQDDLGCFVPFEGACAYGTVFCRDGQPGGCSIDDPLTLSGELDHCGPSCGRCDTGRADACEGGLCRCGTGPACEAGQLCCGDGDEAECVDPQTHLRHCGGCGAACTAGENATTACEQGRCAQPECLDGWGACDPAQPEDCTFDLTEDPLHCGSCEQACPQPTGDGEVAECLAGDCAIVCVDEASRCEGLTRQICASGAWQSLGQCSSHCLGGACVDCEPGARSCGSGGLEVCNADGYWESQSCGAGEECVGEGTCLRSDGQTCSSAGACASGTCKGFFQDADGDGYGRSTTTWLCGASAPSGYVSNSNDCCDTDERAKPGQTEFFTTAREGCGGYDFDCSGGEAQQYTALVVGCNTSEGCDRQLERWYETVPDCGENGHWAVGCSCDWEMICCPVTDSKRQPCR